MRCHGTDREQKEGAHEMRKKQRRTIFGQIILTLKGPVQQDKDASNSESSTEMVHRGKNNETQILEEQATHRRVPQKNYQRNWFSLD